MSTPEARRPLAVAGAAPVFFHIVRFFYAVPT